MCTQILSEYLQSSAFYLCNIFEGMVLSELPKCVAALWVRRNSDNQLLKGESPPPTRTFEHNNGLELTIAGTAGLRT